ncbi:MAG: hypothetical protein IPJ32_21655 [Sphingobacteriaceae bacterium]|nr:hypothetical protein [Sphingobacteriaceae bacterium]
MLFSYHANWESAGGWKLELHTNERKLIFKPMEELHMQLKGKGEIVKQELKNEFEVNFKHGLYLQNKIICCLELIQKCL